MTPTHRILAATWILLIASTLSTAAYSQQTVPLPDAPGPLLASSYPGKPGETYSSSAPQPQNPQDQTSAQAATSPAEPARESGQTKRILGIIPNFRSVSADVHLPPQSVKDKFLTATQDSLDYSSLLTPALLAGYSQARNATPEFRQGGVGYGRYLWHSVLDQTSENYWVEFIVPAVTHEDTRYYTFGHGGFAKRGTYAIKHVFVTRSDAGNNVFNAGEVVGAAFSAALSNAYYPSAERSFGNTAQQWGTSVGIDAFTFAAREFWPDINHALFHGSKM